MHKREHRSTAAPRWRIVVALLIAVSALALAGAALGYVNYVGPADDMFGNSSRHTVGEAPRTYNEVWRPAGNLFKLDYGGGGGVEGTGNPLLDSTNASYAFAYCRNREFYIVDTVTCQTSN